MTIKLLFLKIANPISILLLSSRIKNVWDHGLFDYWKTIHWPNLQNCQKPGAKILTLYHLAGLFYILAACLGVAVTTLVGEYLIKKNIASVIKSIANVLRKPCTSFLDTCRDIYKLLGH